MVRAPNLNCGFWIDFGGGAHQPTPPTRGRRGARQYYHGHSRQMGAHSLV
jgi:hypothetical protein